ncbi:MAG: c-type cytochrome [Saprospiraceae bacterium]|nr:c-type cytochrome [Saprospiraceae bacterium]
MTRAADPVKGHELFISKCQSCHGVDGRDCPNQKILHEVSPLWGDHSYNEAAGLYRVSTFAGYIKPICHLVQQPTIPS